MIKASDILVKKTVIDDHVTWRGVLSIVVEHTEVNCVEMTNVDVNAKIDEAVRNSVLRYIFEDIVPMVHDMGKMSMPYLPTHLQVQLNSHMDAIMDIFLGLEPNTKKH